MPPDQYQYCGTRNGMVPRRIHGSPLKRQLLGDAYDLWHAKQRAGAIKVKRYPVPDVPVPA